MRSLLALLLTAVLAAPTSAQTASFQGLGDLPGGAVMSQALTVSTDGSVIAGLSASEAHIQEAFLWTATEGMRPLAGFAAPGFAVRADGVTDGGGGGGLAVAPPSSFGQAFVWAAGALRTVPTGDAQGSWALDISDTGVIVGKVSTTIEEAFATRDDTVLVRLGVLPGGPFQSSSANGVSADGTVVVGRSRGANGWEAFRWTEAGGMVGIGALPGGSFDSEAFAASADGAVIVGLSSAAGNSTQAFRWTEAGGMQGLGQIEGSVSLAYGVSADGSVVVGAAAVGSTTAAMVWAAADGMTALQTRLEALGVDLTGWWLRSVLDISADGTVLVGEGTNPDGDNEAWRAVLPRSTPTAAERPADASALQLTVSANPLTSTSSVRLTLPDAGPVRLTVIDALGRTVAELLDEVLSAGVHVVPLDGSRLANGVYVVRLTAGARRAARRVTVVR